MITKAAKIGWPAFALIAMLGCSSNKNDSNASDTQADGGAELAQPDAAPTTATTPASASGGTRCLFSADCPTGTYCDLGQCIQSCSVDVPCGAGETCSPRGRCIAATEQDRDPVPVTESKGHVWADPTSALLSDRDSVFPVTLATDSAAPVDYRIEIDAPYLNISPLRGSFEGETTLDFLVDASSVNQHELPGSIRIFTTLGNVTVSAPIKTGLTGTYQGALVYDVGSVPLGSAQIMLDLVENNGDVLVKIDPKRSLLFPETENGSATGRGAFTATDGVDFTVRQLIGSDFGGDRNYFKRPIGRELRFQVKPGAAGALDGSFDESIHGLLGSAVHLHGTVHLEAKPSDHEPDIQPTDDVVLPEFVDTGAPKVTETFAGWSYTTCYMEAANQAGPCTDTVQCANAIDRMYHGPLEATLAGTLPSGDDPLGDAVNHCELEMVRAPSALPVQCALIPALACALSEIDSAGETSADAAAAFSRLFAHTVDPALFVAQDHIVRGVKASFVDGFDSERTELETARAVLAPSATWVLHPHLLDYLSRVVEMGVTETTAQGEPVQHMALRVLARLLYVLATIDGETSRLSANDPLLKPEDRTEAAQERAILGLVEAALIADVLDGWRAAAPAGVAAEFTGILSPGNEAFAALTQGAIEFGVPEGYVPFMYDSNALEQSNFEQVYKSIQSRLSQQADDETALKSTTREFEQNQDALSHELELVSVQLDEQIWDICGSSLDLEPQTGSVDWSQCGASNQGQVGELLLEEQQAYERLQASQQRIKGMRDKIEIERNRIADVKEVRDGTVYMMDAVGNKLDDLTLAEGIINATEKAIDVASNASLWNAFAPAGMAAIAAAAEMARTEITIDRQQLQRAQDIQIMQDNATVEVINGMANIKTLLVDMSQLQVEMRQDLISQLQASVNTGNALDKAKRLYSERMRALARVDNSPLTDPSFRILSDRAALQALRSRAEAQRGLMLAGRALEYELNQPLGDALVGAVENVYSSAEASRISNCLDTIFNDSKLEFGSPQNYQTEFSVRERLGVVAPRVDSVTGEELSEGEQFRRLLLRNENLDGSGGVGVEFSSNLETGNELWPSSVCDDKIASVEAQIVGDFLGDNEAQVDLLLDGGGVLRSCAGDALVNWSTASNANVQAGVNTFGTAPSPNTSLAGLSVASAKWHVAIPGGQSAPANSDVDLTKVEDIVLRVRHSARPINADQTPTTVNCLSTIGAGL